MYYVPAKNDTIDKKLSEFINSRTNKYTFSKFLFIRESTGIYTYLKKRAVLQVQEGKVIVRVGGGWMMIEEFLEAN